MDSPLLAGIITLAVVLGAGLLAENWSWAKPIAVLATIALIVEALWLFLR